MSKTVRYAKDAIGLNVRNAAAGTIVRAIDYGNLMIHDSADAPVKKELNGAMYTWLKVTYYYGDPVNDSATGWVAQENTTAVSTTIPAKSSVVTCNRVLRQDEMLINARYVCKYLLGLVSTKKWSTNAICAALGNMEVESAIGPGHWQNEYEAPDVNGYGLVQWTPAKKYFDWLAGGSKTDIDKQLERIMLEVDGTYVQWDSGKHSPTMTFKQFTQSTKTVSVLAEYFLRCYEQPTNVTSKVANRQDCALKWNTVLSALGAF